MKSRTIVCVALAILLTISIVSANRAISDGKKTITIVNDKGKPIGTYMSTWQINDLEVYKNIMYISSDKMIKLIDISNGYIPRGIQSYKGASQDTVLKNKFLFARQNGKVNVYSLSNPRKLVLTGTASPKSPVVQFEVEGYTLFVVCEDKSWFMYNIEGTGKIRELPKL